MLVLDHQTVENETECQFVHLAQVLTFGIIHCEIKQHVMPQEQ